MTTDLCLRPATELAALLRQRAVSARELLAEHLARIDRLNPALNAIVTTTADRALAAAAAADEALARGELLGPLHGLPVAHKDLALTAGVRTTFGSPIHADQVPDEDELFVERIRDAGAVMLGKTNTPEFGAGSHTFNPVFGFTRNPHDPTRSAGGSSGGAAAGLAAGMVAVADGSDLGGSLRNPAAFCGVVGLRPSPGRVPSWPALDPAQDLSVDGPMGRTVADAALLLAAMAGPDPRVPISIDEAPSRFLPDRIERPPTRLRVALAPEADGRMPIDPRIAAAVAGQARTFEGLGWSVEPAFPDLAGAREAFLTLRARLFADELGDLLATDRDRLKATVVWNVEQGLALGDDEVSEARTLLGTIRERAARFFERYDLLAMPTTQVLPFPVEVEYPTEVEGVAMPTYLDWMESCWCVTVTALPAISVPAGRVGRLPVGLQLVGPPRGDLELLRAARAFERAAGVTPAPTPPAVRRPGGAR
ncbi:MAG TPA: amidase [Actinomycetota bacterium]